MHNAEHKVDTGACGRHGNQLTSMWMIARVLHVDFHFRRCGIVLTSSLMLKPGLYSLRMVVRVNVDPILAYIATKTRCVESSDVWILWEYCVSFCQSRRILAIADELRWIRRQRRKCWQVLYVHFILCETTLSMGIPWYRAICSTESTYRKWHRARGKRRIWRRKGRF